MYLRLPILYMSRTLWRKLVNHIESYFYPTQRIDPSNILLTYKYADACYVMYQRLIQHCSPKKSLPFDFIVTLCKAYSSATEMCKIRQLKELVLHFPHLRQTPSDIITGDLRRKHRHTAEQGRIHCVSRSPSSFLPAEKKEVTDRQTDRSTD